MASSKNMSKKPELKSIRSSFLGRGLALARIGMKASVMAARNRQSPENFKNLLTQQIHSLTQELGELKGSLMKVGQLLSMYGEHFLPKEANEILKTLQFRSPPVAWKVMKRVVIEELGDSLTDELEIDSEPLAAASLGQVHRARRRRDGLELAIKIQYPGVARAIDNDLRMLKTFFSLLELVPKGPRYDQVFEEVREMLHQEVDYRAEAQFSRQFSDFLKHDPRYLVPQVHAEYSSSRVLTMSYLKGQPVDSEEVLTLSQERRNRIGEAFLELYLSELLTLGWSQTDAHLGNYSIAIDPEGKNDRLILLDYGAVRQVPLEYLKNYHKLILGGFDQSAELILAGGRGLGLLLPDDPLDLLQKYIELCFLITEPFTDPKQHFAPAHLMTADGVYDWGASDLPSRVAKLGTQIVGGFRLRAPPREAVFLDRKLGGTFIFLSILKCKINARKLVEPLIRNPPLLAQFR